MLKFSVILMLFFCGTHCATAQSLSEIHFNKEQSHFFYLKDKDSLFVKSVSPDSSSKLIAAGFNDSKISFTNGNFRKWVSEDQKILFEKKTGLYTYELHTEKVTQVLPEDKLQLFQFIYTREIGVSKNHIYFAAGEKGRDKFDLYQLNLQNYSLKKYAEEPDSIHVSNVTVSEKGDLLAYSYYRPSTEPDPLQSGIKIIDLQTKEEVFHHPLQGTMHFYANLDFVSENILLARNRYGKNYLFSFGKKGVNTSVEDLAVEDIGYALRNINAEEILTLSFSGETRLYHSYNISTKEKKLLLSGVNTFISGIRKSGKTYSIYFTQEDGKTPKQLFKTITSPNTKENESQIVFKLNQKNPLENINYEIIQYTNGDQKTSEAYFYAPQNRQSIQKKLPVIVMAYGGYYDHYPDLSYFMNTIFLSYLEKGFGIVFLNTRGVANERRNDEYGKVQLKDTETFLKKFTNEYAVDKQQIFVAGHSHGATMVFYYLTHSDVFAGGIAVNGAADWVEQAKLKSMTGLPFEMGGTPDELPEKYKLYSPIENITVKMKPLLIVAGTKDTQIIANINADPFYEKAKKKGARVEYLRLDDGHIIELKENLLLFKKTVDQFIRNAAQ